MLYIGLDLGTSGLKGLLVDANGTIKGQASREYPVRYPRDGWSEQDPADWLKACREVLGELSKGIADEIGGISFGGQMHGLVILDENDRVIRPAILWNDGRTSSETEYLNETVGRENLARMTANIAFAGFTAPKILWLKKNEPENFARIKKIMLPKDYLSFMLTGEFTTDYSDASGTLLLDVENKRWSREMCNICGITEELLPRLTESGEKIGKVNKEYGLKNAVAASGAGDNAAAAIGTGTVSDGDCNISLGTSGTVFIASDAFRPMENNAIHSFAHATGKWHLMGCILSASSCDKWWIERVLRSEYGETDGEAEALMGRNNVFFLPYLMGERTPHNDVLARAAFIGMRADTERAAMSLAVREGVAFALRDSVEIAKANHIEVNKTKICGGGARSLLSKRIIANALGIPVEVPVTEQGPAYGAAMLAMVGAGEYPSPAEAAKAITKVESTVYPDAKLAALYDEKYKIFKTLYPALKDVFASISK